MLKELKRVMRPVLDALGDGARSPSGAAAGAGSISRERLAADLQALPVERGAAVLVFGSLNAIGFVDGGAEAVVDALVDVFVTRNAGTVMAPTFSIDSTMRDTLASGRVFHVASTPTTGGALAEAFRRHAKARRSIHPTHSFAAIGRHADWLTQAHHRCGTSFGRGSPMARLKEENGHIASIGAELGQAPFFHCLEEIETRFPHNVFAPEAPIPARCRGYHGDEYVLAVRGHDDGAAGARTAEVLAFFAGWFEQHGGLAWRQVGEARTWHIPAQAMYREARRLMLRGLTVYGTAADVAKVRADLNAPSPDA